MSGAPLAPEAKRAGVEEQPK
ncbi:hypothetical protein KIPB_014011, partial [Kipferlia bialata]|eukprot:g14011.t1